MEVEVARRDFWTNENPDPSKWKDVSSAWGLRGRQTDRQLKAKVSNTKIQFRTSIEMNEGDGVPLWVGPVKVWC